MKVRESAPFFGCEEKGARRAGRACTSAGRGYQPLAHLCMGSGGADYHWGRRRFCLEREKRGGGIGALPRLSLLAPCLVFSL
jgi:hypothetical protein